MNSAPQFTGEEIIADVLQIMPEVVDIFSAHGIACASCYINGAETLKDGILAHYGPQMWEAVLDDLNEAAAELQVNTAKKYCPPIITKKAKKQLFTFQKKRDVIGFGLKIDVIEEGQKKSYFLDFQREPDGGDSIIDLDGIRLFLDPQSYRLLDGVTIDYKKEKNQEGFSFSD